MPVAQLDGSSSAGWAGRRGDRRRRRFGPRENFWLGAVQPVWPHGAAIAEIKADGTIAVDREGIAAARLCVELAHQALFADKIPEPQPAFQGQRG